MINYLKPANIDEVIQALASGQYRIVAGCTDHYCSADGQRTAHPILDITGIAEARGIVFREEECRLGALTTWSDIIAADLPPQFDGLKQAARQVGGQQIQNAGTLGGNLCNASPAADGVPCLLALNAKVELRHVRGVRTLSLAEFIVGPRYTALQPGEVLTAVIVPVQPNRTASVFLKLGTRAYQVISIVAVSAVVSVDPVGTVNSAAIAVGACSPVAVRLPALEAALLDRPVGGDDFSLLAKSHGFEELSPISDVRATAAYRLDAARTLVGRALDEIQARLQ